MAFPSLLLSHLELYVSDIKRVEQFYTRCLGFVVTDRGDGDEGMVFLSRNPTEHHQLVLNPQPTRPASKSPVDHISFRVQSLSNLRRFYLSISEAQLPFESVSHGTTWSLYLRDPEDNRIEIFTDTPWYVHQPCKFKIDLQLSDEELHALTKSKISELPGFCPIEDWRSLHFSSVAGEF
jgi:catechol-2,3-dioxygenase